MDFRGLIVAALVGSLGCATAAASPKSRGLKHAFDRNAHWHETTPMGSRLRQQPIGGTVHQTSVNDTADVRYSRDVSNAGGVSNRHWTDQSTGRKVGDRR